MNEDSLRLVQRYRSQGVLVDTNILLLFIVGTFDRSLIARFKRTHQYTEQNFDLLVAFLTRFDRVVTTPNILSEVNSLSGQIGEPAKTRFFDHFSQKIRRIEAIKEEYVVSAEAAKIKHFSRLGLTDSGIAILVRGKYLVLTDDLPLYDHLVRGGIDAINFRHLSFFVK